VKTAAGGSIGFQNAIPLWRGQGEEKSERERKKAAGEGAAAA